MSIEGKHRPSEVIRIHPERKEFSLDLLTSNQRTTVENKLVRRRLREETLEGIKRNLKRGFRIRYGEERPLSNSQITRMKEERRYLRFLNASIDPLDSKNSESYLKRGLRSEYLSGKRLPRVRRLH